MITPYRKKLIPLLVGAACTAASAQGNMDWNYAKQNICGSYQIVHINGIMTQSAEATLNRNRIETAYGNVYKAHPITYGLVYNQTRGLPYDFYQSAMQVITGYKNATWQWFYDAVQSGIYVAGMSQSLTATIAKTVDDLFGLTKPSPYHDQDLEFMRVVALSMINKYSRVVFVPHSQGNLYANELVTLLTNAGISLGSIGVVGVAVPYSSVRTGNTYVTSSNDLVIDSVRQALSLVPALAKPLAPNVTIPYQPSIDKLGHSFISTYMANSTARGMVTSRITSEMGPLRITSPIGTQYNNMGIELAFIGQAGWADCTGTPLWGPFPDTRPSIPCWSGSNGWFVPVVSSAPAGNYAFTTRPGDPATAPSLAAAQANGCVALGAAAWQAWVALGNVFGTLPGSPGNCGSGQYGDTNVRLASRYNGLTSSDGGIKQTTISWKDSFYANGNSIVRIDPVCRN